MNSGAVLLARSRNGLLAVAALLLSQAAAAQDGVTEKSIVVVGSPEAKAEIAADQAHNITLRPPAGKPLARRFEPICIKVVGLDPAYADLISGQIATNVRLLNLPLANSKCQPNALIVFVRNGEAELGTLRKRFPEMFVRMSGYEIKRAFGGSGGAFALHSEETRNVDGRPIPIVVIRTQVGEIESEYNATYKAGRLATPIRRDILASIVVFDKARANGRTAQQLADYATFRILAPVQDVAESSPGSLPSILTLFAPGGESADGLTEFDWAYLKAFYRLELRADASALHDATKRQMMIGKGQDLSDKAAGN